MKKQPRILLWDVENSPNLFYGWDLYESNALKVIKHSYLLSFAYRWLGEKKIHVKALCDYPNYKRNKESDKELVKDLWTVLNGADIICAHNGDGFDTKKANSRFIFYSLDPPSPSKSVDTLKLARSIGYFGSNKLDSLAQYLNIGRKLPHTGKDLWFGCMTGDMKDWAIMKSYNKHDVALLEAVYLKLRPYSKTHPDLRVYTRSEGCPVCKSTHILRRGYGVAKSQTYQRFQCKTCGKWFNGALIKK